ncbi:MAG: FadR/GntR family transcriptional regulator [Coprococcus sp.]
METGERAYEKIINYVEKQIMHGKYKKGDKLPPERELAALLGSSRNSIREGLSILERMGAISSQQGAGNFISDNFEKTLIEVMTLMFILEEGTFREISEFRYALEMQALTLAIEHVTEEQLQNMEYYMEMLEQSPEEITKVYYDKKIHYTIAEASQNRFIIDNLQALTEVMDSFIKDMRAKILSDGTNSEGLMMTHRGIVEAIRAKDLEAGRRAMNEHFNYIYDYLDR